MRRLSEVSPNKCLRDKCYPSSSLHVYFVESLSSVCLVNEITLKVWTSCFQVLKALFACMGKTLTLYLDNFPLTFLLKIIS